VIELTSFLPAEIAHAQNYTQFRVHGRDTHRNAPWFYPSLLRDTLYSTLHLYKGFGAATFHPKEEAEMDFISLPRSSV